MFNNNKFINEIVGTHFEAVHSTKESKPNNPVHYQVQECFRKFLEMKTLFDSTRATKTNFNTNKIANNLNDDQTENFFVSSNDLTDVFSKLKGKLSSGLDQIPNIILKNFYQKII